ncbi:MAG: hypothetical protein IT297_09220, partial [Anaerolineae bacterium]|nr:hypothetical protein [Anaerolineae bacterium]
ELEARSQNIQRYFTPLDKNGLTYGKPVFRDVQVGNNRLRVLTVPMVTAGS